MINNDNDKWNKLKLVNQQQCWFKIKLCGHGITIAGKHARALLGMLLAVAVTEDGVPFL